MADNTTTDFADLMREARGPIIANYPKQYPLFDRIKRETGRKHFSGTQIRVPIIKNQLAAGHGLTETGTVNEPAAIQTDQAHITPIEIVQPLGLTPNLLNDSADTADTSWVEAGAQLIEMCFDSLSWVENLQMNGDGTALLASIGTATTDTTLNVGTTAANLYRLREGMLIDVRNRTTGALSTNGLRRRITAVADSTGIITCGDSGGNFSTATTDGIYIHGSYNVALQGLEQAVSSSTTTFEAIDRSAETWWRAIDGRNGVTTAVDLTEPILDGAERRTEAKSGERPSWYIGDPAVLDRYMQTKLVLQRYPGDIKQLDTGFEAVAYRSKLMFYDHAHTIKMVRGINPQYIRSISRMPAPDWDTMDGSMFKRFNRSRPVEAWLVDSLQLGWNRLQVHTYVDNLNQAA